MKKLWSAVARRLAARWEARVASRDSVVGAAIALEVHDV